MQIKRCPSFKSCIIYISGSGPLEVVSKLNFRYEYCCKILSGALLLQLLLLLLLLLSVVQVVFPFS